MFDVLDLVVSKSNDNNGECSMFEIWSILGLLRIISGHWSEGMRISKSNDNNGILNGRDSYKKIWARSESTLRDCCYPILSVSNAFVRKSCGCLRNVACLTVICFEHNGDVVFLKIVVRFFLKIVRPHRTLHCYLHTVKHRILRVTKKIRILFPLSETFEYVYPIV